MTVKTETIPHDGGFLASEAPGAYSREAITVAAGQNLQAGTVIGKIINGAASFEPDAGNTGLGTLSATPTVGAGAKPGTYRAVCIGAATDGGVFNVYDPDNLFVGQATVGVAFSGGGLTFTIVDASTDFAPGDLITITVAAGSGLWKQLNVATGADGTEQAQGILFGDVDAAAANKDGLGIVRGPCEVQADALIWPSGISANAKAAALAELAARGIIARAGPSKVTLGANTAG